MGGRFDSSRTRVAPVFSALESRQEPWLSTLLGLPRGGASVEPGFDPGPITECAFSHGELREKRLPAPPSLLRHLVQQVNCPDPPPTASSETQAKRDRLFDRDPDTVREALALIDGGSITRGWHVFEGPTAPDVYIETPRAIVVIEGKRTEAGPTVDTKWMPGRHQMWRHIDAAWEGRGGRAVFGFFIVQGETSGDVPRIWSDAVTDTTSARVLAESLPHRASAELTALKRCFLGLTTWQKVVETFGLPRSILEDEPDR
ncbi:MAG: hypothetical protein IPJ56_09975 [Gemmatimonadetes bacterium]|nr:hypothetical protein [Gemmatimonadota bacterium]